MRSTVLGETVIEVPKNFSFEPEEIRTLLRGQTGNRVTLVYDGVWGKGGISAILTNLHPLIPGKLEERFKRTGQSAEWIHIGLRPSEPDNDLPE